MVFGKKKKESNSEVVDATIEEPPKPAQEQEMTPEQKELFKYMQEYQKEYAYFVGAGTFVQQSEPVMKAESMNIQFATYVEIRKLRKAIEEMNE